MTEPRSLALPAREEPTLRPTASISSMKTLHCRPAAPDLGSNAFMLAPGS